jgi:hypothetical protein
MAALGIVFEQQTAEGITLFALHLCRLNEIEMSPLYPFDFDALWCGILRWNPTSNIRRPLRQPEVSEGPD